MRYVIFTYMFLFLTVLFPVYSYASEDSVNSAFSSTGLSIPRFVSLSNSETNVRVGPGREFPIKSVYRRSDLPVEIILEYDHWRKIRDHDGEEGWVYYTLLSGERFGLIQSDEPVFAYEKPFEADEEKSRPAIELEPMVQVSISSCDGVWCYVNASGFYGWIERKFIWGVYEHENFD